MKRWLIGLATLAVVGCSSGPAPVPPTELTFHGETIAIRQEGCRTRNSEHLPVAVAAIQTMFLRSGAMVIDETRRANRAWQVEPRTLNASVCAAFMPNGNEPYGLAGYAEISMAHVFIRITDAVGAIRYFGEGRAEYRTSGRQNFACGWREVRWWNEARDPNNHPCPASPAEALEFASRDAFNSLKKY